MSRAAKISLWVSLSKEAGPELGHTFCAPGASLPVLVEFLACVNVASPSWVRVKLLVCIITDDGTKYFPSVTEYFPGVIENIPGVIEYFRFIYPHDHRVA